MQSKIFNLDWTQFEHRDPKQRAQLAGALQVYMAIPNRFIPPKLAKVEEFVKAQKEFQRLHAFTLPSDFPAKPITSIEQIHFTPDWDSGFEQIFDIADFTGTSESGFDILAKRSGLTFLAMLPGEKAKVYQAEGGSVRCYFTYYAGALGWYRQLFDDRQYWTIEDNAIEFRSKAYSTRASVFYALLEAVATAKGCCAVVPPGCTDCAADARSIALSINFTAVNILNNMANMGLGLNVGTEFIVLTPVAQHVRVQHALDVRNQQFAESARVAGFNFRQITTTMLANPNRLLVILPKRGLKGGYRMDLTLFEDFDMLSYTDTVAGWMRYGGCVADTDQIDCIDLEAVSGSCPSGSPAPEFPQR